MFLELYKSFVLIRPAKLAKSIENKNKTVHFFRKTGGRMDKNEPVTIICCFSNNVTDSIF